MRNRGGMTGLCFSCGQLGASYLSARRLLGRDLRKTLRGNASCSCEGDALPPPPERARELTCRRPSSPKACYQSSDDWRARSASGSLLEPRKTWGSMPRVPLLGDGVSSSSGPMVNTTCNHPQVMSALNAQDPAAAAKFSASPMSQSYLHRFLDAPPDQRLLQQVFSTCNNY
jgi:hypothetical protein